MTLSDNFRKNVRQILRDRGVSENQFWRQAGLGSGTYFNKVMNGISNPTLDYCETVAKALDWDVNELLENPKKLQPSS